jgi:putative transcriptional regulator
MLYIERNQRILSVFMITQRQIEGFCMLAIAAFCFWLPHRLKQPGVADQKILVAAAGVGGGSFDHTVVFVVRHNGFGALGFVLNRTSKDTPDAVPGGPVRQEAYYTVHSLDVTTAETLEDSAAEIGYTPGKLTQDMKKPKDYIVFKGYASWGIEQLDHEIERNAWKVIDFDRDLVFHTDPTKMYDIAVKRPAALPE